MQLITLPSILRVIMVYILDKSSAGQRKQPVRILRRPTLLSACNIQYKTLKFLFDLGGETMHHLQRLWRDDEGQDIAEYAVMLAVILVIVVGTIQLIGSSANNVFSNVASSIQ